MIFSLNEIEFLRENYIKCDISELSIVMGRSKKSIRDKAWRLGIAIERVVYEWDKEDILFLSENYGVLTVSDIAIKLNKSFDSVKSLIRDRKQYLLALNLEKKLLKRVS